MKRRRMSSLSLMRQGACGAVCSAAAVPAPLDAPIAPITGRTLARALPELEAFAASLGVTVTCEPLRDGCDGYYRPSERWIAINAAVAVNQQTAALAHELAHALVDIDRQDDDPVLDYATEELVAKSVGFTVCGFLGLDTAENSIPYLTVWSEHADAQAFERIAALVDRLARRIEDSLTSAVECEADVEDAEVART